MFIDFASGIGRNHIPAKFAFLNVALNVLMGVTFSGRICGVSVH